MRRLTEQAWRLEQVLAPVEGEAPGREFGEFAEKRGIGRSEIEGGFALHAFLQLGRNAFDQRRIPIERHQVEANVGSAANGGAKEKRPAIVAARCCLQIILFATVGANV